MATLGPNALTLVDWAKRRDPDGGVARIAELLNQKNDILDDIAWVEGNLPTGHRTTVRTGLPTAAWRLLNQGTQPTKSTTAQIDEATGILQTWSEVDKKIADLESDVSAFRFSEAQAHIEALMQEFVQTLFFGNQTTAPEEFTGFAPRFSSLSAENARNIIDAQGTGSDNSSIWLMVWNEGTVCAIFPKGSQAGIDHEDLGVQTVSDANGIAGAKLRVYQDRWEWTPGIALKDWRQVSRIANIDISNLVADSSAADLFEMMTLSTHAGGTVQPPQLVARQIKPQQERRQFR